MTELEKLQSDLQLIHDLVNAEVNAIARLLMLSDDKGLKSEIALHLFEIRRYAGMTIEV